MTKKPTTLDKLVDVLTTFCDEESLEFMCADDLLHTCWHDLDEDQRYWRDLWMETRSKVLDNGNANLRAAQNEISQYTMSWNRYVTNYYQKDE